MATRGAQVLLISVKSSQECFLLCPEWPHLKMLSFYFICLKSPVNSNGKLLIIILEFMPFVTCQRIDISHSLRWPQDWKRSVFIPIPKKGNAKECSNYSTMALISHASKVMLKILQARLQQYVNHELPRDVLKKVSRGLSGVEAGNPGFPRLVQVTSGGFSWWL